MRAPLWLLVAGLLSGCTSVSGRFRGVGGPVADWALRPNYCTETSDSRGVDLYYQGDNAADTEVVVMGPAASPAVVAMAASSDSAGPLEDAYVLVRIPGRNKMAVLRSANCSKLDVEVDDGDGAVSLDCQQPEIGHVKGSADFYCN